MSRWNYGSESADALSSEWKLYSIEGNIDSLVSSISFGAYCYDGGKIFFDDFSIEIEIQPGEWEKVSVDNQGFENWSGNNSPDLWEGTAFEAENFKASISNDAVEGKHSLLIQSDGYNVISYILITDIFDDMLRTN